MKQFILSLCILAFFGTHAAAQCAGFGTSLISNNNILTCVQTSATLQANATGGTSPYSYSWGNGCQAVNCQAFTVGVYTVTATDALGCTATATTIVTQDITPPVVSVTTSNPVLTCANWAATLIAVGGDAYYWSGIPFPNGNTATVSSAGTYTVTATNMSNGCSATATITIIQDQTPPNLFISANTTTLSCASTQGATLTASGGDIYMWNNGQQTNPITVYNAGVYTVTATNASNGCTATNTITITGSAQPNITITPNSSSICAGVISAYSPGQISYLWSNLNTVPSFVLTQTGTYTVTCTNSAGCTNTASVTINNIATNTLQIAFANIQNPTGCQTQNGSATAVASGGIAPYTYIWDNSISDATNTMMGSGSFFVTVSDAAGCGASASVTLTAPNSTVAAALTNIRDTATCNVPGSATAVGSGGAPPYTYQWSTGAIGATLNAPIYWGNNSNTYYVTVSDANGCWATASVAIVSNNGFSPYPQIVASAPALDCQTSIISLSVTPALPNYTYQWSFSPFTTPIINVMRSGIFTVTITNIQTGCSMSATQTVTDNGTPVANATITPIIHPTNCITNSGEIWLDISPYNPNSSLAYTWSNGATTSYNNNFVYIYGLAQGWYSVTITQPNCDTIHRNYYVPAVCQTIISGKVLAETNNNCTDDAGDAGMQYALVQLTNTLTNQMYSVYTNQMGEYSITLDTGHYSISSFSNNNVCTNIIACPANNTISLYAVSNTTLYANNNFFYQSAAPQYDLSVYTWQQTARPAFPRQFTLYYQNNSNVAATNAVLSFTHDAAWSNLIMVNGSAPTTNTATTKTWNLGTIPANTSGSISFTMELPQSTPIGILLTNTVNITANGTDCNFGNNTQTWTTTTTNSFDPNDKTLLNPQDAQGNILNDNAPLHYQIRFQNTGTDTAYTVVVRDTFDLTHLDKSTFKIIGASHNMQTEWVASNIVEFRFPNIYLVDSLHNEPLSHGWLQFSISRKPNTPLYSSVNNSAAIFFDYNDAVITNTVHTQFVPFLSTENTSINTKINLDIQPNPTTGIFNLTHSDIGTIKITDILGKIIISQTVNGTNRTIDLSAQATGTYFVTLITNKGSITKKVAKVE